MSKSEMSTTLPSIRRMNVSDLAVPAKDIPVLIYVRLDHRYVSAEAKL